MPDSNMPAPEVVIIGAGAAGMMAAAVAARAGSSVTLLEKNNKTGVKILMSGGTRCNITQDTDARGITSAFGKSGRFLQPSVGRFGPREVVDHFESLGVPTKREVTGKIFPQSNRAVDVRDALHRDMIEAGVRLKLASAVKSVRQSETKWTVTVQSNDETSYELTADRIIVTAGGKSWPGCGTTGDAYNWLQKLGHQIVPPRPALVPLVGGTEATHNLSGLTLNDVVAEVHATGVKKKKSLLASRRSSWLFTHFGFSGPAAMDVSGTITGAESYRDVRLQLDLLPEQPEAALIQEFSEYGAVKGKRNVQHWLNEKLPSRLAAHVAETCNASKPDGSPLPIAECSKATSRQLIEQLKVWQLPVHDTRGFAKAEVTAGGVALNEVDRQTMQSKLHEGLYIAGEVLDVDGWIGGYNFQAAFSTGRAAGLAAAT